MLLVISIFLVVILFLLANNFLLSIKSIQPKITVSTPSIVLQNPVAKSKPQVKTIVKVVPEKHTGLLHKLKHLL